MERFAFSRTSLITAFAVCLAATVLSGVTPADELGIAGIANGLVIHGPEETLRQHCFGDSEGRMWFQLPNRQRFELITSTNDPAIANPGDGAFHAFDENVVRAALAGVRYPLSSIRADVYLLPYPRRGGLESAAGPELILLSPGVRPLSQEQQHAEFVHELGHVVHYALMPELEASLWQTYRRIRGIEDAQAYSSSSRHADRPHEIFAEDFRALFGDALANYSGTIENAALAEPNQVTGLEGFVRSLSSDSRGLSALAGYPNPSRGAVRFVRRGASPAPLDLFDVTGRCIATLQPTSDATGVQWQWDGRVSGRPLEKGVVFARMRDREGASMRITLLGRR